MAPGVWPEDANVERRKKRHDFKGSLARLTHPLILFGTLLSQYIYWKNAAYKESGWTLASRGFARARWMQRRIVGVEL
jgi:hypothetical protein